MWSLSTSRTLVCTEEIFRPLSTRIDSATARLQGKRSGRYSGGGQKAARNQYFAHIQQQGQWKQGIQGYLASIHFADTILGRVLDALDSGPNAGSTIVVLWSDHGWQLGEKEHWQKFTPWRAVTRIPLMVRVPINASAALPNGTPAGSVCREPVNLLSLFPTLFDLCNLPANSNHDGPTLLPLLQDPLAKDWKHDSVTYLAQPGSYSISGRSHRYIHWADGSEELYDIDNDPYEWTNLASSPQERDRIAAFAKCPKDFAPRIEPSVESLTKLVWRPATDGGAPPSKPEGSPFPVHFINKHSQAVELFWMSPEASLDPTGRSRQAR